MINYKIQIHSAVEHLFLVNIEFYANTNQTLYLPNWTPGSYLIRDFCKHIVFFAAQDHQGNNLSLLQVNKNTYQLNNNSSGLVTVSYHVYAWDFSVRGAHLDNLHGFFSGACVFFAVKDREMEPCCLQITAPDSWQVATGMKQIQGDTFNSGVFQAENYFDLIDYPCEMGCLDITQFVVNDIPHYLVINGEHLGDTQAITKDLTAICQTSFGIFYNDKIFDKYLFLITVVGEGYGGLEHKNSTALLCSRYSLIAKDAKSVINFSYINFLGLCAHEYFHNWNVKRIRPEEFICCDLTKEVYTKQLWAYEGITSYLDDLILYKSGVIDKSLYLQVLSSNLTQVLLEPGRFEQDLYSSSFNAWTKFYQQGENAINAIVSYYKKGAYFALFLDLEMRLRTQGEKSILDLLQALWVEFGKKNIGTKVGTHQELVESICSCDFTDVFAYLTNCKDAPLVESFAKFGVNMDSVPRINVKNNLALNTKFSLWLALGLVGRLTVNGFVVKSVLTNSLAAKAGISAADVLIAINSFKITPASADCLLSSANKKSTLDICYFRGDRLLSAAIENAATPTMAVKLDVIKQQADANSKLVWP